MAVEEKWKANLEKVAFMKQFPGLLGNWEALTGKTIKAVTQEVLSAIGLPPPAGETQDQDFAPDRLPAHDEQLRIAGVTLRALHTPGHTPGSMCFRIEGSPVMFSGWNGPGTVAPTCGPEMRVP